MKKVRKAGSDLINRVPNRVSTPPNANPMTPRPVQPPPYESPRHFQNRRSWIEDSRLTQSQFNLGSESGGNESDNSAEDPTPPLPLPPPPPSSSTPELPPPMNRNSHLRQSLQRKPLDSSAPSLFARGGVRSSLQSTHRNSFPSFDGPDITGNSLGQAGTRRTVYLIDENADANAAAAQAEKSQKPADAAPPSTFLMFNKISNVVGALEPSGSNGVHASEGSQKSSGSKNDKKANKSDSEHAIWYEYGCV